MRPLLILCAVVGLWNSIAVAQEKSAATRPNVILILADDVGAAELGCYGHREHQTPHLDRLAVEGLRLDTFYSTPLCTPTRVCLMTGQYGFRNGYLGMHNEAFIPSKDDKKSNIANHFTIGKLMKSAGYNTAMAGKWQLAGEHPTLIHECGFDEYRMWAYVHNLPEGVKHSGRYEDKDKSRMPARFWHPSIVENGKYRPTNADDYGPDLFMDFMIDFIRRSKDRPFFVYHTSVLTHNPFEETPDPKNPGERGPRGFKSNLEYLDHLMGRLRQSLEEMKLSQNTVVIFVGDNGTGGRGKGTVTESGVRVPFIAWGPGWVQPHKDAVHALGDLTDIMPTLADLSRAELPKDRTFDGKSMVPLLRGEVSRHRDWIYSYLDDGQILRDERWLLLLPGRGGPEAFFDCGLARDGKGYKRMTELDSEAKAARERFAEILTRIPEPKPREGAKQEQRRPRRARPT